MKRHLSTSGSGGVSVGSVAVVDMGGFVVRRAVEKAVSGDFEPAVVEVAGAAAAGEAAEPGGGSVTDPPRGPRPDHGKPALTLLHLHIRADRSIRPEPRRWP